MGTLRDKNLHLLKESDQLACSPLVRFGKVDILQVQHQSLTIFGSVHTTCVCADGHAHLSQLLKHVHWRGLCIAMNGSHLGGSQLIECVV